jgi:hypothetical protein
MSSSRSRTGQRFPSTIKARAKRQRRSTPFSLEPLENRLLLSVDVWKNTDANNEWSDANNWSERTVPGAGDDVNVPSGFPTIVYDSTVGATTIDSLTAASPLSFTGGSLTIASSSVLSSTITDTLSVDGGAITVTGAKTSLSASGDVTATSGSLSALGGATLTLSGLTSVSGSGMSFASEGSGSVLDLSQAASFTGSNNSITDNAGGVVRLNSGLNAVSGLTFIVDGTGSTSLLNNLTSITDGGILVGGGTYSLTKLADVDGSTLDAGGGGTLSVPGVNQVAQPDTHFNAIGPGSVLNISNVSNFGFPVRDQRGDAPRE